MPRYYCPRGEGEGLGGLVDLHERVARISEGVLHVAVVVPERTIAIRLVHREVVVVEPARGAGIYQDGIDVRVNSVAEVGQYLDDGGHR